MLFQLTVVACVANALFTVVAFIQYGRARMADRSELPGLTAREHAQRLARLDRVEKTWQSLHFITLSLFVLFGVLILVQLSHRLNTRTIT